MTETTAVRMDVPRLDSTPSIPTLPRMEVRAANTAGENGEHDPLNAGAGFLPLAGLPCPGHQQGPGADDDDADDLARRDGFMEENNGQDDGQDDAGLVDGGDLVDCSELYRPEIAEP